jgi:hypothetical protein
MLDNGAHFDTIDDDFRSTPLGILARRGRREGRQAADGSRSRSQQSWRVMGDAVGFGREQKGTSKIGQRETSLGMSKRRVEEACPHG